ncbi:MAG: virulence RhuM family protein [Magnetococcales bacterium]|nr:virulence RhuM family protein [Magnetococcales bacterium]MBF0116898.1 virulence RhuM family protein [Magnetococcales bacterium]
MPETTSRQPFGELILYQTEDGRTRIQATMHDESVWLTQNQMAELFDTSKQNISMHIRNIFAEGELMPEAVIKELLTTANDGKQYRTQHFNLEVIIAVGYRVRSHRGVQFRTWATQRLREYLVKGFTLDDERLKQTGGGNYFDELLARIRDIRASEKLFYRKILDIYATSVDYDPRNDLSQQFFAAVQNKMHWAAHGHTAAEIVRQRADATQPKMGMIACLKERPTRADAVVAKNYLTHEELDALNRIVTLYLDFAELQAINHRPMTMRNWIAKLDDFLRAAEREILTHPGTVRSQMAQEWAHQQYDQYRTRMQDTPSPVEIHFQEAIAQVKQLERNRKLSTKGKRGTP